MQKQVVLDGFQNVVGSGVAICDMNKFIGSVIEKITLTLGGTFTKAMITLIQLKLNGKVVFETDGSKLDATNIFNRGPTDATILKLDFMDRSMVTVNSRQAGSYDMSALSGIRAIRLEVTTSGATSPTLVGFADVSPPSNDPTEAAVRGLIVRRHRATYVAGASGSYALPIPHLDPSGGGSLFRRIYLFSANITAIKTVREGIVEHELTKLQNENAQKDNFKVPQANLIVFDPTQDGQMQGRLWDTRPAVGVRSAQFYATFSAGETITIETEELLGFNAY